MRTTNRSPCARDRLKRRRLERNNEDNREPPRGHVVIENETPACRGPSALLASDSFSRCPKNRSPSWPVALHSMKLDNDIHRCDAPRFEPTNHYVVTKNSRFALKNSPFRTHLTTARKSVAKRWHFAARSTIAAKSAGVDGSGLTALDRRSTFPARQRSAPDAATERSSPLIAAISKQTQRPDAQNIAQRLRHGMSFDVGYPRRQHVQRSVSLPASARSVQTPERVIARMVLPLT